ncbi:hypothetical protein D3C81_1474880 [compost metagenome]
MDGRGFDVDRLVFIDGVELDRREIGKALGCLVQFIPREHVVDVSTMHGGLASQRRHALERMTIGLIEERSIAFMDEIRDLFGEHFRSDVLDQVLAIQ